MIDFAALASAIIAYTPGLTKFDYRAWPRQTQPRAHACVYALGLFAVRAGAAAQVILFVIGERKWVRIFYGGRVVLLEKESISDYTVEKVQGTSKLKEYDTVVTITCGQTCRYN